MRANKYPDLYRETFLKALDSPVKLEFSSNAKAVAFRVELYTYRWAIRDELPATKSWYKQIMQIRMSIKDNILTIESKKRRFLEKLNET